MSNGQIAVQILGKGVACPNLPSKMITPNSVWGCRQCGSEEHSEATA